MPVKTQNHLSYFLILSDLFLINVLFHFYFIFTNQLTLDHQGNHYFAQLVQLNGCWILISQFLKYYQTELLFENMSRKTLHVVIGYVLVCTFFIFALKLTYSSRLFYMSFTVVLFLLLLLSRYTLIVTNKKYGFLKPTRRKAIIIGSGNMLEMTEEMLLNDVSGYELMGCFNHGSLKNSKNKLEFLKNGFDFAIRNQATDIFSTILPNEDDYIHSFTVNADKLGIRLNFIPNFQSLFKRDVNINLSNNIPIITFRKEPLEDMSSRFKKRMFDIVFSLLVITLLLSWLIPIVALLIKLTTRGPVFFTQIRSGRNNKVFKCIKFRSMFLNQLANDKSAVKNDSRVTKVGKFIRRTNIDELPQFFNVLLGDMSVVGPRPHMVKQTEIYQKIIDTYMVRLYLKPGITGLSQITGLRGELTDLKMAQRVERDISYMESWSMWLDMRIILRTILLTFEGDPQAF